MDNLQALASRWRGRIIRLALLFILLAAACYPLSPLLIADLAGLLPGRLYQTMVAEALWARLLLCLAIAATATAAGLLLLVLKALKQPKAPGWAGLSLLLFSGGAAFARLAVLPPAIPMLAQILGRDYPLHITISGYISFCLLFMIITGLLFQEPLLALILYRAGLVEAQTLRRQRKAVYLLTLILMAILTPTQDALTLLLVMLPFAGLYELSILWLALLGRAKAKEDAAHG